MVSLQKRGQPESASTELNNFLWRLVVETGKVLFEGRFNFLVKKATNVHFSRWHNSWNNFAISSYGFIHFIQTINALNSMKKVLCLTPVISVWRFLVLCFSTCPKLLQQNQLLFTFKRTVLSPNKNGKMWMCRFLSEICIIGLKVIRSLWK